MGKDYKTILREQLEDDIADHFGNLVRDVSYEEYGEFENIFKEEKVNYLIYGTRDIIKDHIFMFLCKEGLEITYRHELVNQLINGYYSKDKEVSLAYKNIESKLLFIEHSKVVSITKVNEEIPLMVTESRDKKGLYTIILSEIRLPKVEDSGLFKIINLHPDKENLQEIKYIEKKEWGKETSSSDNVREVNIKVTFNPADNENPQNRMTKTHKVID